VAPPKKELLVDLPAPLGDEIAAIARRTGRSVAFVARRALAAAKAPLPPPPAGARAPLALTLDEDDAPNTLAKLRAAAGKVPLADALAGAWLQTRARFEEWASREEAADAATNADDLDGALAAAAAPATGAAELATLAGSVYPRVRALVAAHPRTAAETLALLAGDRERVVREAVAERAPAARRA
jgi:hypothetical protein